MPAVLVVDHEVKERASQRAMFEEEVAPYLESWADIEGEYRYALGRAWGDPCERVLWVMLNPSTADATENDPTLRRCIGLSRSWGFGALVVVNLFALRATDPRALRRHPDPIGGRNNHAILEHAHGVRTIVVAWGAHGTLHDRDRDVLSFLGPVRAIGLTKDGHPRHPLYVRNDATPLIYKGRGGG